MCGIAGIVDPYRDDAVTAADIHRMCQAIVHRGPDDEGIHVCRQAGLGMRRLSIIDLSTGHQPIHNEDRTVWLVFNGEIYNFLDLRKQLETRGHRFYTNTDSEVIVHLYEEYGSDCVLKLRGMFALAVWDEQRQSLLLARDRFGKKPLYYAVDEGRLLFGSEIKTLLAVAPHLAEVNPQGVLNFFYFGYVPDPLTAFTRVHKLSPGYLLEFGGGRLQTRKYWDLPAYGTWSPGSEEECIEELERRLAEAVKIRLASDVPLGALLSGGVDSSIVVALMARESSRRVKTFSIGFSNQDFNEAGYARAVAQRFNTEHHELQVDPQIEGTLDRLTHSLEEPFGDSSMVPTYHVCRMAREHVTVALAGDGGDELFAGYDRYHSYLRRRSLHAFSAGMGNGYRRYVHPLVPTAFPGRRFIFNLSLQGCDRYLDAVSLLPLCERESTLFTPDFVAWACNQPSPYERFRNYLADRPPSDRLSEVLYLDAKTYLAGDILTKVDRMSMATSLEVRAPLLDHEFAEWAAALSPSWKNRLGESKYILKKLGERIGVPAQVLYRPKKGFSMPLVHWFRQETGAGLLDILLEPRTIQRGYLREESVRRRVVEHRRGIRDRSWELWHLLIFELWHRNFLESATQCYAADFKRIASPQYPTFAAQGPGAPAMAR